MYITGIISHHTYTIQLKSLCPIFKWVGAIRVVFVFVFVCCSMLLCVAVCCSVLHCALLSNELRMPLPPRLPDSCTSSWLPLVAGLQLGVVKEGPLLPLKKGPSCLSWPTLCEIVCLWVCVRDNTLCECVFVTTLYERVCLWVSFESLLVTGCPSCLSSPSTHLSLNSNELGQYTLTIITRTYLYIFNCNYYYFLTTYY